MSLQLPEPAQLFTRFHSDCTSDGAARDRFEQLVSDLVSLQHDDATTVSARNHNDWGLDTFVGNLGGGSIAVWQSKYNREWQTDSPQGEVRASFTSAQKQAALNGYRIAEWTLVVPAILHPEQYKWFSNWGVRQTSATKTRIRIWQGDKLRRKLLTSEAIDVRREYFGHTLLPMTPSASVIPAPLVALIDEYTSFDGALFVRQLHEAGHIETGAACGMYFATDALFRDLESREAASELQALRTVQLGVQAIWETSFNEQVNRADESGRMPSLYSGVITASSTVPDAPGLALQPAHKQGAAHMLVEQRKAGWVKHWRAVSAAHPPVSSAVLTSAEISRPEAEKVGEGPLS